MQQGKLIIETPFIKVFLIDENYFFVSKERIYERNKENYNIKIRTCLHTASDVGIKEYVDMESSFDFRDDEESRDKQFKQITIHSLKGFIAAFGFLNLKK